MSRARTTPSLEEIRREIDALDAQLLALLERRFEAIDRIRAAKANAGEDGGSPMRPGREAVILRRLDRLRGDHLPQALMVRVWRSIMAAATTAQANTTMHVSPVVMADPGLIARVLDQFPGLSLNVAEEAAVAAALAGTSTDIAVLPRSGGWIEAVDRGSFGDAKVIGCLPLLGPRNRAPDLLIFGHARQETTGDDLTIAVLRNGRHPPSDLMPLWSERHGNLLALCLPGCLSAEMPDLSGQSIRIAGHYPSPLEARK